MKWQPFPIFSGGDVFIIGGGPSLKGFDWNLIKGRQVIGCNDAYTLGEWVTVCHFGDWTWYTDFHKKAFDKFGGLKFTSLQQAKDLPGVLTIERDTHSGFAVDGKLAWCGNTGISSINLSYILGGSRAVLLGFDMKRAVVDGKETHNWHPNPKNPRDIFNNFIKRAAQTKADIERKAPDFKVVNCTPGSALGLWPIIPLEEVL